MFFLFVSQPVARCVSLWVFTCSLAKWWSLLEGGFKGCSGSMEWLSLWEDSDNWSSRGLAIEDHKSSALVWFPLPTNLVFVPFFNPG